MSMTGKLQAINSRGFSLRWLKESADHPDYETLVLDLLSREGVRVASYRKPVKVCGSVVTKESEEAQRAEFIAWAEELTRNPLFLPQRFLSPLAETPPTLAVAEEPVHPMEEMPHGEEVSPGVSGLDDVEAHDPV